MCIRDRLKLGLNKPTKEEEIVQNEVDIFESEKKIHQLDALDKKEYDKKAIADVINNLRHEQKNRVKILNKLGTSDNVLKSMRLQAIQIQRDTIEGLFEKDYINENVYYEYDAQLDLQQDALEYPITYGEHYGLEQLGVMSSKISYRSKLKKMRRIVKPLPIIRKLLIESDCLLYTSRCV